MRRGDIWTVSGGKDYAGKPRPVVIVQDDSFDGTDVEGSVRRGRIAMVRSAGAGVRLTAL